MTSFNEWWEENYGEFSGQSPQTKRKMNAAYDVGVEHQQAKVEELQKRVDLLEATLQSERWDRGAGFKIFFKARDMHDGWHGFERKPEYYEVGCYWMNGGKSIYLHGDEWCDRETAINSLTSVKEQALKGEAE
ncbi:hypothetical protein [Acinetobacter seifertii]|uniref:DUF1311 domain-containing protein n=1 Tax=Acinetobacter seifertii TaxID=1530123 RepID=A0ABX8LAD3_9GAMM|nr:hypothetical protein [Acinetobacter seifertii]QXB47677.1 hypothetical protein I6L30_06660 [Acinetobacter seifertii]